jgi:hypothetical protein
VDRKNRILISAGSNRSPLHDSRCFSHAANQRTEWMDWKWQKMYWATYRYTEYCFLFQKDKVVVNTQTVDVNAFNFCWPNRVTREYCALC